MAPPPAINLAVSDPTNFSVAPSSKIHPNTSSKSSEEERESTDGAVDEQHHAAGGSTLAGKRPRGRPPGSKNKPKTPTYVSVDPQDTLRPHILEIAPGADISACLAAYARTRGRGVSVVYAVGSVAGFTFRHQSVNSSSSNSPSVFLKGKQDIVSLSGTILPDTTPLGPASLTVLVAGPHGQLIGGPVEGRLVAEGSVMVMATTFATATYEKLPLLAEAAPASSSGLGGMGQNLGPSSPALEDPRSGGYHHPHHPGNLNMNMGIGGGLPETSSYANWFLQHQQQQHLHNNNNSNGPPLYMNN